MNEFSKLQELADRLGNVLPPGLGAVRDELKDNFRAILQSRLEELDLVSREQFDVQKEVLRRTQARLKELERRLEQLEQSGG